MRSEFGKIPERNGSSNSCHSFEEVSDGGFDLDYYFTVAFVERGRGYYRRYELSHVINDFFNWETGENVVRSSNCIKLFENETAFVAKIIGSLAS
jgi:hypothetical protein